MNKEHVVKNFGVFMTDLERELQYAKGRNKGWDEGYRFARVCSFFEFLIIVLIYYFTK